MNASILRGYNVVELITDQQAYASISMWLYHFHFSGQLTCGSQPTVPMCVVCSLCHSRLSPEKNLLWFFPGRGGCDTGYVVWSYIGLLILFLPDGYAMLMRLNKAKTAVHDCQCLCGMALCMRKVLARPWVVVWVCQLFFIVLYIFDRKYVIHQYDHLYWSKLVRYPQ